MNNIIRVKPIIFDNFFAKIMFKKSVKNTTFEFNFFEKSNLLNKMLVPEYNVEDFKDKSERDLSQYVRDSKASFFVFSNRQFAFIIIELKKQFNYEILKIMKKSTITTDIQLLNFDSEEVNDLNSVSDFQNYIESLGVEIKKAELKIKDTKEKLSLDENGVFTYEGNYKEKLISYLKCAEDAYAESQK